MKKNTKKAKAKIPFFATILTRHELQYTAAGTVTATAKDPSDKDETATFLDSVVAPPPPPPPPPPVLG